MANKPTLSIMMANYNYGQYIGESLEAILTQSFSPTEVIVTDDGSTDNSVEVIRGFQKRYPNLRLLRNEKNMGVLYSINRCLSEAKGDYVYPASSDDKVLPGFFEKSMDMFMKYPQAGLCCSDLAVLNTGYEVFEIKFYLSGKPRYFSPDEAVGLLLKEAFTPIMPNTVIIKHSALLEAGGYLAETKWSCDSFSQHVACFRHGFCYIPEALALVRRHSNQWGSGLSTKHEFEREVVMKIMDLLRTPAYQDVYPMFKKTGCFSSQPWDALYVAAFNRKYRDFLTFKLIRYGIFDKFIKWPIQTLMPQPFLIFCHKVLNVIRHIKSFIFPKKASDNRAKREK